MEAARKRGAKIGRPRKLTDTQIHQAAQDVEAGINTITARAKELGVCRDTLSKAIIRYGACLGSRIGSIDT